MYSQVITQIFSETTFDARVVAYNANSLQCRGTLNAIPTVDFDARLVKCQNCQLARFKSNCYSYVCSSDIRSAENTVCQLSLSVAIALSC